MPHPEYIPCGLDRYLHLDAVLYTGGHRFLAEYVIALFCKCRGNLCMKVIMHSDHHSVCQTLAYSAYGLSGGS